MVSEHGWQRVRVGDATISVADDEPIAVVRLPGESDRVATWPDLDLGARATGMTLLATPDGVWVVYHPLEAQDDGIAPGRSAAVHVGLDARLSVASGLGDAQLVGATTHGLWLRHPAASSDPDETAAWLSDDVRIRAVDGSEHRMPVDRRIAWVFVAGARTHLAVHSDAPRRALRGWTYATAEVGLPPGPLPAELRTRDQTHEPIDDSAIMSLMGELIPERVPRVPSDPHASWRLADVPVVDREAAVAAVVREFADVDAYGTGPTGETGPLSPGLAAPRVEVRGEWPGTRVEVSFRHPFFPAGRLRRTLRVFDAAGRFSPPLYASVHLMEDLATSRLPPIEAAVGGIPDI